MSEDSKVIQVIQFTGCSEETARKTLEDENWNVIDAVDKIIDIPPVNGNKYIPAAPVVDDQLNPEVREKIKQARQMADLFTFAPQNDLRGKASHYPEEVLQGQRSVHSE